MSYSRSSILINDRTVQVSDIISQSAKVQSEFESNTFSFIRSWLNGEQHITLKTSGSTGTPKEITLTRQQLLDSATRTINKLRLTDKYTALVCLDTKYIAGKMMLVRALEASMNIVAIEPSSDPLKDLPVQPDFGAFVPLQLDEIFKNKTSLTKLNRFKSIIIGGAAVSPSLLEKIKTLSCDVYATYGMTETVSHIALQKLNGSDAQTSFEVLSGITITTDERDCLVITLPEFIEPVITNDVVQVIDGRHFKILGRFDNVINSGGIKLMPESIEKKIEPLLAQPFFVAGVPDDRLGTRLVLIIEGTPPTDIAIKLKNTLPAYEVPKEILHTGQFIRTETHKINRAKSFEKALKSKP